MDLKIRKPTLSDLREIVLMIDKTDISEEFEKAMFPKLKLAKLIFDCQQLKAFRKNLISERVKSHSQFNKMIQDNQRRFRIGGRPRSKEQNRHFMEQYLHHDTMIRLRGKLTREDRYYSVFMSKTLRIFDRAIEKHEKKNCKLFIRKFSIIFSITSLFDLRPEDGICKRCKHFKFHVGCQKPKAMGRDKVLMLKCPHLTVGRQDIHNYSKRHNIA